MKEREGVGVEGALAANFPNIRLELGGFLRYYASILNAFYPYICILTPSVRAFADNLVAFNAVKNILHRAPCFVSLPVK